MNNTPDVEKIGKVCASLNKGGNDPVRPPVMLMAPFTWTQPFTSVERKRRVPKATGRGGETTAGGADEGIVDGADEVAIDGVDEVTVDGAAGELVDVSMELGATDADNGSVALPADGLMEGGRVSAPDPSLVELLPRVVWLMAVLLLPWKDKFTTPVISEFRKTLACAILPMVIPKSI